MSLVVQRSHLGQESREGGEVSWLDTTSQVGLKYVSLCEGNCYSVSLTPPGDPDSSAGSRPAQRQRELRISCSSCGTPSSQTNIPCICNVTTLLRCQAVTGLEITRNCVTMCDVQLNTRPSDVRAGRTAAAERKITMKWKDPVTVSLQSL